MRVPSSPLWAVMAAAALTLAACGGGASDVDPAGDAGALPADDAATSEVDAPADDDVELGDPVTPGSQENVVNECVADDGGTDAADTFDEAGLALDGRGRLQFEPLNDPVMVTADQVTWLDPDDIVMGVLHESGEAQAYPISQMTYHHVANTSIAGEPYLVTY